MGDPSVHRDCPLDCKVYVGNLGSSGNKTELERSFGYYGPLRSVWVARNPPGFAFVEFEDPRDATDAVRELNGRTLCGCRVRVELSTGEKRSWNRGPPPSWSRRPRDDYRRRSPRTQESHHHASSQHPLSWSTSPLSASCDQRAPSTWLVSCHMTQAWPVVRLHRPLVPDHAVLSVLSNLKSAAAYLIFPTSQLFTFPMSTQPTSSSPRLTNKSRKNPQPAPNSQPSKHLATSGKSFQHTLPSRPPVCFSFAISSLLRTRKTNLHVGGAAVAVAADLSPETGGGIGPSLVTGTTNLHAHSPDLAVVPGLMTE